MNKLVNDMLGAIGKVPTIQLHKISPICQKQRIYLKLESCNPGGSIKDKNALYFIEYAEREGFLNPGSTIIESSSGNFGIGLAMVGAYKNYKVIIVIDAKTPPGTKAMLKAYGAELIELPLTSADKNGSMQKARMQKAKNLQKQIPNSWYPCQHLHPENPTAHIEFTAMEILEDFGGAPDVIAVGVSTSGQLKGIGSFFKKNYPNTKIIATDVAGSVIFGTPASPYKMTGVGLSFVPPQFSNEILDAAYSVNDSLAFSVCRALAKKEGLLLGGSTGAILAAALSYAKNLSEKKSILVINPDKGDRYLDTIYNDEWIKKHNINLMLDDALDTAMHSLVPVPSHILNKKGHNNESQFITKNASSMERIYSTLHK